MAASGCVFDGELDATETRLGLRIPAIDGLEEVSMTIFSGATCAGNRALGGSPLIGFEDVKLQEGETFAAAIPVGELAFEIRGMSTTQDVCVGACQEAEVIAGMQTDLMITALEVSCTD